MGRRRIISLLISPSILLLLVFSMGSAQGADPQAVIQGTASYRERMALPPEAVFEATLENTYWKLTRLGSRPVELGPGGREVFLTLVAEGQRVRGFSGCNRFIGSYHLDGNRLAFQQMAGTRMACAEGMEQEGAFLKALQATASWEIRGEHLDLYNADGVMLLRFEPRYMG